MKAFRLAHFFGYLLVAVSCALATPQDASQWVRPQKPGDPLIWGRKDGILFGLPSNGGLPGPRGLIRVGVLSQTTGKPELLNFVAIEPVIQGPGDRAARMAFSELEPSQLDGGQSGKRLWLGDGVEIAGKLSLYARPRQSIEVLSVPIEVERFSANGAHVHLIASIESDRPDELRLAVFAHEDSPPLEELTLTATMGNYERLRHVWLKNHIVDSRALFSTYTGDAFVEKENYPLEEMLRAADGSALVFGTTDEADPSASVSPTAKPFWHYRLNRLTQYWRVLPYDLQPDLRVRVNARRVYWASHAPLPHGIAFENFEVRQRYLPGQRFIFGVTSKAPRDFEPTVVGLPSEPAPQ